MAGLDFSEASKEAHFPGEFVHMPIWSICHVLGTLSAPRVELWTGQAGTGCSDPGQAGGLGLPGCLPVKKIQPFVFLFHEWSFSSMNLHLALPKTKFSWTQGETNTSWSSQTSWRTRDVSANTSSSEVLFLKLASAFPDAQTSPAWKNCPQQTLGLLLTRSLCSSVCSLVVSGNSISHFANICVLASGKGIPSGGSRPGCFIRLDRVTGLAFSRSKAHFFKRWIF